VMSQHFPPGEFSPLYVLVESGQGSITDATSLQAIGGVAQSLEEVDGVSQVDYYSAPADQLAAQATQARTMGDGLTSVVGLSKLTDLKATGNFLMGLAVQYPGVAQSQNFQQATANLNGVSTMANQVLAASSQDQPALLANLRSVTYKVADNLEALAGEFRLQVDSPFVSYLRSTYFSQDGTTARLNVVLSSEPYSSATIDTVARVRQALDRSVSASGLAGVSYYVGGESATRADIMSTNDADFGRVTLLATAGIFIVIMILLRSLLAPLYMVATVLFNYGATLGIATWLFLDVMKHSSMIYMLPIFIFVVLVALGADYNIFLVSRIREESQKGTVKEGVSRAVANTGGVITACGIILAGTFATLTTAPLQMVFQIGGAIAVGVLIDTFIVRALLVPSLATLAGRWSWWPSRLTRP
jgi:RND superfamily putative drug exporter